MRVSAGKLLYQHGTAPCSGTGLAWSPDELDAALQDRIPSVVFDDQGKADIQQILGRLAETDFAQDGLRAVLADPERLEDWRVGEAIAEAYLVDHRGCFFPWPDMRDERAPGSSLPGADLVGFREDEHGYCLAFGEVKTSAEQQHPPRVVHGRGGLDQQLETLHDSDIVRNRLVAYLCHRATAAEWRPQFEDASRRYLQNTFDYCLYGVLVRDVDPNVNDVRRRIDRLAQTSSGKISSELLALYLPFGRIDGMGEALVARRRGRTP